MPNPKEFRFLSVERAFICIKSNKLSDEELRSELYGVYRSGYMMGLKKLRGYTNGRKKNSSKADQE